MAVTVSERSTARTRQDVSVPHKPDLVPELLVDSVTASIDFWCGLCGFELQYQRSVEGFAYIARGSAHVMLEQAGVGRNWLTGPLDRPLGRGINFQIAVPAIEPIVSSLRHAAWPLFMEPEMKWYQVADDEIGVQQFLVTDPDGYLLRFQALGGEAPT
ncbi:MAG: bleomycin resistance protein [Mycobacteriales bacterium]